MKVACLTVSFYLHGCRSLKEKRRRLAKLRDKFGKQTALAVCESNYADELKRGQWSFIATAAERVVVEQCLTQVERYVASEVDADVVGVQRDWLS